MKSAAITRKEIFQYAKEKFRTKPEYLWAKFPNYAVLRNPENSKWYAMNISQKQLRLESEGHIDILDVKCDLILILTCYIMVISRLFLKNHKNFKIIFLLLTNEN